MYKNKKYRFENFWLQSAEANLKFVTQSRRFHLNNNGGYSECNVWLSRREVIDKVLQRQREQKTLPVSPSPGRIAVFSIKVIDFYNEIIEKSAWKYRDKNRHPIYEDDSCRSADIMCSLSRINARARARREKAGINNSYAEIELPDEAVAIALRAALKNRKRN